MFVVRGVYTIFNHQYSEFPLLTGRHRGPGQAPIPASSPNCFRDKIVDPSFFFSICLRSLTANMIDSKFGIVVCGHKLRDVTTPYQF